MLDVLGGQGVPLDLPPQTGDVFLRFYRFRSEVPNNTLCLERSVRHDIDRGIWRHYPKARPL